MKTCETGPTVNRPVTREGFPKFNTKLSTSLFYFTYLFAHSEFHDFPAYSDIDKNSNHIQEHNRHRSCKDRFHKETSAVNKPLTNGKTDFKK